MKNLTSVKIPKQYTEGIEEIQKASAEDKGYWLYTKEGYHISHEDFGIMIGRYDTQKELLVSVRSIKKDEQEEPTLNKELLLVALKSMKHGKESMSNRHIREWEFTLRNGNYKEEHKLKAFAGQEKRLARIKEIDEQIKLIENM